MPYFAVLTAEVLRCVLADDAKTACVHAISAELAEGRRPKLGEIFHTAELGQPAEDNLYVLTKHVVEAGDFPYAIKEM